MEPVLLPTSIRTRRDSTAPGPNPVTSNLGRSSMMPISGGPPPGRRRNRRAYAAEAGDRFERLALWTVRAAGARWGFHGALLLILTWAASGPYFRDRESWTTAFTVVTTSVTFLLVFLIPHAQNRESKAVHLKLDELILAAQNARNELICIEHLTEEQLDRLGRRYCRLAEHYRGSPIAAAAGAPRATRGAGDY
jgi:low affinity Fe/Cu permease